MRQKIFVMHTVQREILNLPRLISFSLLIVIIVKLYIWLNEIWFYHNGIPSSRVYNSSNSYPAIVPTLFISRTSIGESEFLNWLPNDTTTNTTTLPFLYNNQRQIMWKLIQTCNWPCQLRMQIILYIYIVKYLKQCATVKIFSFGEK